MKKFISLMILGGLLVVLAAPLTASAVQGPPETCLVKKSWASAIDDAECVQGSVLRETHGMCCLVQTIDNVTSWLFYLMTVVAVLLFIIGGVFYMASAGDPEKAKKGKTIIIYAIIGLVIALIAKMIPSLVTTVVS